MKHLLFISLFILCTSLSASAQTNPQAVLPLGGAERGAVDTLTARHPEYLPSLEIYTQAPEIVAKDTLGTVIKLSDYRGKYVVLDFWATWCGDCRREVPMLKELFNNAKYKTIGDKEVQWLSFSFDDKESSWRNFLRREQFPWQQVSNLLRTRQDPTFKAYQLNWIPAFFIIDPEGKIIAKAITARGLEDELLRITISKLEIAPHL